MTRRSGPAWWLLWWRGFLPGPKSLARRGEDAAARYLRRNGYTVLDRNVRLGRYEVDLIAREGDTIVFVEVKTRRHDTVSPEENVSRDKQRHIRAAARLYASRQGNPGRHYRFDVVAVLLPETGKPNITLYRDAFGDE